MDEHTLIEVSRRFAFCVAGTFGLKLLIVLLTAVGKGFVLRLDLEVAALGRYGHKLAAYPPVVHIRVQVAAAELLRLFLIEIFQIGSFYGIH